MQNYKPGTAVSLTLDLVDENGVFITPTALSWRIIDEAEVELQAWAVIATLPTTSSVVLTIPAELTVLTPPALRAIRTIEIDVVTEQGTILLSASAMLQGVTALAFGLNSFQTYVQALLLSEDSPSERSPGWLGATRENREKALIEAYSHIMRLPIGLHFNDNQSMLQTDTQFVYNFGPIMLRHMTPAQMTNLYVPMMKDLCQAQLIEADYLLVDDPVARDRTSGLTSKTVGESSQFYRPGMTLDLPVCPKAMKSLERWVRFGAVIGRS